MILAPTWTQTRPDSLCISPSSADSSDDLPAPTIPTTATSDPRAHLHTHVLEGGVKVSAPAEGRAVDGQGVTLTGVSLENTSEGKM